MSKYANAIRALSIDAIEKAASGHPGMPLGMAEIAEVLWKNHLNHSPNNPSWWNRDRFIISNGHGSMLLYALLHLSGYQLSKEDLQNFRQLGSKTPGHPEIKLTPGVETTTGPLGQGLAAAIGMALAQKLLANEFNRDKFKLIDHYTYVFLGDGCVMEGISHEASSLAGLWKLGKLITFYDYNQISIDGDTKGWLGDDSIKRFSSYGWQVIGIIDGHDKEEIHNAIIKAKSEDSKPSLIICKTVIGKGSPHSAGLAKIHGAPLGAKEAEATKKNLSWPFAPFEVPDDIKDYWDNTKQGDELVNQWQKIFVDYQTKYPKLAKELVRRQNNQLPPNWPELSSSLVKKVSNEQTDIATRKASQQMINLLAGHLPEFIGGSADLSASNLTLWEDAKIFAPPFKTGNYICYGVREFGMSAIMNGLSTYGGFLPFGGTFLVFSDYARPAIRLSALMKQRVIFVFTHDSIGLGEDGPTHQPIEQANSLRIIPNLDVWRPCDSLETTIAWLMAIENNDHPTALLLSRQNLPAIARNETQIKNISKGGYILRDTKEEKKDSLQLILLATGSEVSLAMKTQALLNEKNINVRVVSMPSTFIFDRQDVAYKKQVLPNDIPILAIEAGSSVFWYKYVGSLGKVIGIDDFGTSAPADKLFLHFGFSVDKVASIALQLLNKKN
ncbi:MAG: transketolase [SAR324 cluster bacterium]|nr:transketolase [SAR324 cluster bacterium]